MWAGSNTPCAARGCLDAGAIGVSLVQCAHLPLSAPTWRRVASPRLACAPNVFPQVAELFYWRDRPGAPATLYVISFYLVCGVASGSSECVGCAHHLDRRSAQN